MSIEREVVTSFEVLDDLDVHASVVVSPTGKVYADLREYVPSLGAYGRGLTLPADKFEWLESLVDELGGRLQAVSANE
jgi:hypothetical protein